MTMKTAARGGALMMFPAIAAAATLSLATSCGAAEPEHAAGVVHLRAGTLERDVAHTTDGLATSPMLTGQTGPVVLMVRRDRPGEVELHESQNDVFVAHAGRASVLVGGRVDGQRQTAANEWRGGVITGARIYPLRAGDVLFIPAGLPHQVIVPKGASFSYLAFKSAR